MKILITGSNGYIGSNLVRYLLKNTNHQIIGVDFNNEISHDNYKFLSFDILENCTQNNLYSHLDQPDIVVHLAWQDGFSHNALSHINSLPSHYKFIRNLIDSGCKNINIMGTMHEIGYFEGAVDENTPCNPLSLYGIAKNALRQSSLAYTEDKNISLKWLRGFYITGNDTKNHSIFTKITQFEQEGQLSFPFTSGLNKYDFIPVEELITQIAASILQTKISGIINICSGKPISLKDQVEHFLKEKQFKIRPQYGAFPSRKYDSPAIWGDNRKINLIMQEANEKSA